MVTIFFSIQQLENVNILYIKNFHGSLTTVVRAQSDPSKTANIN